jgi:hypothetical protein
MKLIQANYGGVDCTDQVKRKINGDKLIIKVCNDIIGDPIPGTVKYFTVTYEIDGVEKTETWAEGTICSLPKTESKRLGIFYSNNNHPVIFPTIKQSLDSIAVAAEGKADIITCMWKPFNGNPFQEIISWYQSQSHLNQLLQIMQCLYTAREIKEYDYVSFLEHDVLYPEGYFDYPDFNEGEIYTNMNYMGVNKDGWQQRKQNDEPFHQMTMRFKSAIEHCENIIPNALVRNAGMIESQTVTRKQWESIHPAVHVNHGYHFTSHNSIYGTPVPELQPYWGNHEKYKLND